MDLGDSSKSRERDETVEDVKPTGKGGGSSWRHLSFSATLMSYVTNLTKCDLS